MPSPNALVVTSPTSGLVYVRGALISPFSVASFVFSTCVGVGYAGIIGAVFAMVAFFTGITMLSRFGVVRRSLDRSLAQRARAQREAERSRALAPSGAIRMQQYVELRDMVAEIEKAAPGDARRFELEDLLDHFVRLAVSHQRCLDAVRLAGMPVAPGRDDSWSKRRREIVERRIRHRDECLARVQRLSEELEAVDELIRLVAQRAACPTDDDELDREIERRLWELDEVDAALHQLSA
jgi:hypothetical protein